MTFLGSGNGQGLPQVGTLWSSVYRGVKFAPDPAIEFLEHPKAEVADALNVELVRLGSKPKKGFNRYYGGHVAESKEKCEEALDRHIAKQKAKLARVLKRRLTKGATK